MKNIIILILFTLSLSKVRAQQKVTKINLNETVYDYKTTKTCLKYNGLPLNGTFAIKINRYQINNESFVDGFKQGETTIFRNKKLAEKGSYIDNLKEGEHLYYNEDGSIRRKTIFKSGKKNGLEEEYHVYLTKSNFKNDLKDSTETVFYQSKVVTRSNYKRGKLEGWSYKYFYPDSIQKLREQTYFANGSKIKSIVFKEIKEEEFTIVDSLYYNEKKLPIL